MTHFKQVNEVFESSEDFMICDYFDLITKLKINETHISAIQLNISSLPLNIDKLKLFLSLLKVNFDIISTFESRIVKNNPLTTKIDISGYNIEHTPTESKAGGYLLYISDIIFY